MALPLYFVPVLYVLSSFVCGVLYSALDENVESHRSLYGVFPTRSSQCCSILPSQCGRVAVASYYLPYKPVRSYVALIVQCYN